MEPITERDDLYCARCGNFVQRRHTTACESCGRRICGMCNTERDTCAHTCPTCKGAREVLHMWERPGGPPGNGMVPCPDCSPLHRDDVVGEMPSGAEVTR